MKYNLLLSMLACASVLVMDSCKKETGLLKGPELPNDSLQRTSMVFISDLHMGEARAVEGHYCWFSENSQALAYLLDSIGNSPDVRKLVILGDLFDGWVIPYRWTPYDTASGVHTDRDYFMSVAGSIVNAPVVTRLQDIAAGGKVELVYVPGNHDMLLTREILEEIIPGIRWQGSVAGMGAFNPVAGIEAEHGHRFDLFNCPQPLVSQGHMLPPGYFVSRLQAEGLRANGGSPPGRSPDYRQGFEFIAAWAVAIEYLKVQYAIPLAEDSVNITMDGIGGYAQPFSFNSARDMYNASIEEVWPQTQQANGVPVEMPVIMGILNGNSDMYLAAATEYFASSSPSRFRICVFGHTHHAEILRWEDSQGNRAVYANTGTWENQALCAHPVRTFVTVKPGEWTGSERDSVALYQVNTGTGGYGASLLDTATIVRSSR